ncbi:hypothetical protein [Ralstonia solanacearum]|uniref:hypothetical protein n=1 Tax=Ralstonia solanacearum TaxID=305 RepID=UPI0002F6063D|nr:hypothetical protein [Ralstonia solanacearum]
MASMGNPWLRPKARWLPSSPERKARLAARQGDILIGSACGRYAESPMKAAILNAALKERQTIYDQLTNTNG